MAYTKARMEADRSVVYEDDDGNRIVRRGGHRNWRNNNPGNIEFGGFAERYGAIGFDKEKFAIFPDEAMGRQAMRELLKTGGYGSKDLGGVILRWSQGLESDDEIDVRVPKEKREKARKDVEDYRANMETWTGISRKEPMAKLDDE